MFKESAREIDAAAAAWVAREDRAPLSAADETSLKAWLEGDIRRRGAYARMRALAIHTGRARALSPNFDPVDFAPPPVARGPSRRFLIAGGGLAAASLGGAAMVGWAWLGRAQQFSTHKGEVKIVPLADGSVITLNTATRLAVSFSGKRRDIRLYEGEALFDVAKDADRPFIVSTETTQVRAVGTSFSVSRLAASAPVDIIVREGVVEVTRSGTHVKTRIAATARATARADSPMVALAPVSEAQLQHDLAWREGRLVFEGETLDRAAAKFARYSDIKIIIDDPQMAREEIAGLFQANDPVGFAESVAISLNGRIRVSDGAVRISR